MKKILVVDDSDVNLFLIQTIFENESDIQIIMENDSRNTFSLLKKHNPHILLLDLMMPKMNGFDILEQINNEGINKDTVIIVISAYLNQKLIKDLKNLNVKYFFNKPIDLDLINREIQNILYN